MLEKQEDAGPQDVKPEDTKPITPDPPKTPAEVVKPTEQQKHSGPSPNYTQPPDENK